MLPRKYFDHYPAFPYRGKPLALLNYALRSFLRGRRRAFSSILGIVLAIAFVAGTFIAIDSSTRAAFEGLIANPNGDFGFSLTQSDWAAVRGAVANVSGVTDAAVYMSIFVYQLETKQFRLNRGVQSYAIDPGKTPSMLRGISVNGSLDLPRGTIGITDDVARELGVDLGDVVRYNYTSYDSQGNRNGTWLLNLTVSAVITTGSGNAPLFYSSAFVNIRDADWVLQQLNIPEPFVILAGELWIDHARFLDPYNLDLTQRNLARLVRQIEERLASFRSNPWEGRVTDYISGRIPGFSSTIMVQRVIFLALSLPVILLGIYLGMVGVDLGHAERRRELAVLKTRGARQRQVIGILILDAVLGGILATVIGLPIGLGFSRVLLAYVNPFSSTYAPNYQDIILSSDTVVSVLLLSIGLMMIVSYRSAKRTANLPVIETLRYYAPGETKIHYKPNTDIILIALAVATYGIILWSRSSPGNMVLFLVGMLFYVMLPFAPVFLIIGTTRLLTRATGRVYEWTSRVCKPFAKNLYYVINRNLTRNPRRSANIAIIIALGLGFGVFIFANLGSQIAYQDAQTRASIGADMAIYEPPQTPSFRTNVSGLEGVVGVTRVESAYLESSVGSSTASADVYEIEPDTFFSVTQPEGWYFDGIDAREAAEILGTHGRVLVSRSYRDQYFVEIGDSIRVSRSYYNGSVIVVVYVDVTIGGVAKSLPGSMTSSPYFVPVSVFGSVETLHEVIAPPENINRDYAMKYLVDLAPGANWRQLKTTIQGMGAANVQVYEEKLEEARAGPLYKSFMGFIYVEIAYLVVILTAGLGLIIYAATMERDAEFAAITARGSSGWQTAGLLVGEAASIMLIGLIIGVGMGLVTAYLTSQIFFSAVGGPAGGFQSIIPMPFIIPIETLILIVVAPLAMLLTVLLVSWRVARMDIARVLKMRGG